MTAILTVQNVAKSYGPRTILGGVSLAIHAGDRIGVVGLNGAGKSTLLRLIVAGADGGPADPDDLPDAGLVTRQRELTLEYVPQEPRLDGARTVQETLRDGLRVHVRVMAELAAVEARLHEGALGGHHLAAALERQAALHDRIEHLGGWDREHEIRGLAAALELPPPGAVIGRLSGGERRRVALARALLARPDLLALDEPTNHLDPRTVEWLEGRLGELESALLLVTHDRYFLDRVANRILEIDRGRLFAYEGGYRRFLEQQAERLDTESSKERARASFVRRELAWVRRGPKARSTKQKARLDRFAEAVAAKPGADGRRPGEVELRLGGGGRLGKTILELRSVGKSLGGRRLFRGLDLILKPGDRLGIVGDNGVGKTTLIKLVMGALAPDEGEVVLGQNTRLAYLDQGRAELDDRRSVLEEVAGDSEQVELESGAVHVRTFLRLLLFDDQFADAKVATLSGGERNRVQLAKLLRQGGNLLVLDEPTNDLDIITLGVLEEALASFPGCALIVSHDRWFLDKVATGILAFERQGEGCVVTLYEGDYSAYAPRRDERARALAEAPAPSLPTVAAPPRSEAPATGAPRRLAYKERQELATIEERITDAEGEVATLEGRLADPALYRERAAQVPELVARLDQARAEVERLYRRWEELSTRAE